MRLFLCLLASVVAWPISAAAPDISPIIVRGQVRAVVPDEVAEYHLVRVQLQKGERVSIYSEGLFPVDAVRSYEGVAFTGPPGRYAVSVINTEDPDEVLPKTYFVRITPTTPVPPGPGPGPGPGPDPVVPVPTGFAGEVYQQAVQVRDKSGCTRLAENYRKVAAMIAAGGINQVVDAKTQIVAFNQALNLSTSWKPFGVWIGQQANAKAQTITAARAFFEDTALGLETASK